MRKLPKDSKKHSTLKKDESISRRNTLARHKDASLLLSEVFNKLLNKKSNIIINDKLIFKLFEISDTELTIERKSFFQSYYHELKKIHQINCKEGSLTSEDPISDFITDLFDLGQITKDEMEIANLYKKKTASQLSFYFDAHEKESIDTFSTDKFLNHPKVEVLKNYLARQEILEAYEDRIQESLELYLSTNSYEQQKSVVLNKFKLKEKTYKSPSTDLKKLNVHYYDFILKFIVPSLSLYVQKIQKIDSPLLKRCTNLKCQKLFPTFFMRNDSKVCSKICGTEKNRKSLK